MGKPYFANGIYGCVTNSVEAGATQIRIHTLADGRLTVLDDGNGKGASRAKMFTALYSGSQLLVLHAKAVRIRAVSLADPEILHDFGCLISEQGAEELVLLKTVKKDAGIWPHNHPYGSDTTFFLSDEDYAQLDAKDLAEKLSVLCWPFRNKKILLDGNRLPDRPLFGTPFSMFTKTASGCLITLNLYNPRDLIDTDKLRIAGSGKKVPFLSLFKILNQEQREMIPDGIASMHCCGVLSSEFFGEYMTEGEELDIRVLQDPNLDSFIRTLAQLNEYIRSLLRLDFEK